MIRKYKNVKCTDEDGNVFDSRKELRRWYQLKALESEGKIKELKRQVNYELIPAQRIGGRLIERRAYYVADFDYIDESGAHVVEDAKGFRTDTYILKRKLMLYVHGIQIKEV